MKNNNDYQDLGIEGEMMSELTEDAMIHEAYANMVGKVDYKKKKEFLNQTHLAIQDLREKHEMSVPNLISRFNDIAEALAQLDP